MEKRYLQVGPFQRVNDEKSYIQICILRYYHPHHELVGAH